MTHKKITLLALFIISIASSVAMAGTSKSLGKFGSWNAYEAQAANGKLCYMVSKPISENGNYKVRGEVLAFITHRPSEGVRDVFSYQTGYTYKDGSAVRLTIGSKKFTLFTHENMAWARDIKTDRSLASAISKGSTMVVKGNSSRGTLTTDKFSLKGSGDAYKAISKACPK